MKKLYALFLAILPVVAACTYEIIPQEAQQLPGGDNPVFTAYLGEANDADTKLYLDDQFRLHWNSYGDNISVFAPGVHSMYAVERLDYTNYSSAKFYKVDTLDVDSPAYLDHFVSVYPYSESNALTADGTVFLNVPAHQYGYNNSTTDRTFTYNDYPMVAVTENLEDYILRFRATCGVLVVPIKGSGNVVEVALKGNNGEAICGPATVDITNPKEPVLTLGSDATDTIVNKNVFELGKTPAYVAFVLPPITFENGFTLEIHDVAGNVIAQSTDKARTIQRGVVNTMGEIEVDMAHAQPFANVEEMAERFDTILDYLGWPCNFYNTPDDWGILTSLFCSDVEGADLGFPDSNYNWFSICGEMTRQANYRNPAIRFMIPIEIMKKILDFNEASATITGQDADALRAQARVLRAYLYTVMAPQFQFGMTVDSSAPCVPIIDSYYAYDNMSRASVQDVYSFVIDDLTIALEQLGNERTSKKYIDKSVAHGLRARANLAVGNYTQAYEDARLAAEGYTPASIEEVSVPAFMDIEEHNWIWGFDMRPELTTYNGNGRYATTSSWLRSFSAKSYSAGVGVYACINNLLYDRIPSSDVRKGWWVNDYLESPLIDNMVWRDGTEVAWAEDKDKVVFIPYTNVKFGCNPVATVDNAEDMPLMRVEEMLLIQAEAKARLGDEAAARSILDAFVGTYRDPEYNSSNSTRTLLDEIWFQRRVELWGEGFYTADRCRLDKPVVRFHEGEWSSYPDAFRFNMPAGLNTLLLPIPQSFINNYPDMEQNPDGEYMYPESYGYLRDGVTD